MLKFVLFLVKRGVTKNKEKAAQTQGKKLVEQKKPASVSIPPSSHIDMDRRVSDGFLFPFSSLPTQDDDWRRVERREEYHILPTYFLTATAALTVEGPHA